MIISNCNTILAISIWHSMKVPAVVVNVIENLRVLCAMSFVFYINVLQNLNQSSLILSGGILQSSTKWMFAIPG